jgi:hypothetical protein
LLELHEQQKLNSQKNVATSSTTKTHPLAQEPCNIETWIEKKKLNISRKRK